MSYKIAVGSSDGEMVDLHFGAAEAFLIYEAEGTRYSLTEKRYVENKESKREPEKAGIAIENGADCSGGTPCGGGCGSGSGAGCQDGQGTGCGGMGAASGKAALLGDCRSVVCKKIGFQVQKELEKRAISAFDVSCSVREALDKLTVYYDHVDKHKSLRNSRTER
ncbi:MAG: NifB/NifX family molybdenum-iron cluster-binding protein [Lachnospiraceae bacterium]